MTVSEANILQKRWGIRYSKLVKLPYFDIVCFHVIDPMHHLLLGTAKKMMSIWKEEKVISKDDFNKMQEIIDKIRVPGNIGRIPYKIDAQV